MSSAYRFPSGCIFVLFCVTVVHTLAVNCCFYVLFVLGSVGTPGKPLLLVFVIIIMAGGNGDRIWNMMELTKDQYEMRVTVWLVP